ncbi:MAG: hypothetical protein ACXWJ0_00525 [Xanthobacteraceae bacterium]
MRIVLASFAFALMAFAQPAASAAPAFGFDVDVALSPKAAALLKAKKEGIVVAAYYTGEPVPAALKHADEEGMIDLATENVTIPGAPGRATVTGNKVNPAQVGWVKSVHILVNVFTARHSGDLNLIDCGIFDGSVAEARAKPVAIACKLIGEN